MPKDVDHDARRRELADAACTVIARRGLVASTLAMVAAESGWSIGSIRHYFATKDELLGSALWRVGERIDARIRRRTGDGMAMADLRAALLELLPLDADRRKESLVYLAFIAQSVVAPELGRAAEEAARRLQAPLAARLDHLVRAAQLPTQLDTAHEAARLRVLLDGLSVQLVTTPRRTTREWAVRVLDDHLAALSSAGPDQPG